MPSSVLNQALVYKTSQANIADGGLNGTINVTTRKPLNEKTRLGGSISVGGVYADLPKKTSPQLNANVNWKSDDNTLGAIAQLFAEKRYIRRDSVSRFAYSGGSGWDVINTTVMKGITDASLAGSGYTAAELNGVRLPGSMSSEFVEGVRDRKGGMVAFQFKPNDTLDVGLTGFYSRMRSDNYGRLNAGAMFSMLQGLAGPTGGGPNTSSGGVQVFASIKNPVIIEETTIYGDKLRVLKSADILFPTGTTPQYIGNSEASLRTGAFASSGFVDLDATWKATPALVFKGLVSTTRGVGSTNLDQTVTYARYGTGTSFSLNGLNGVPTVQYYGVGANVPVRNADGSGYGLVGRGIGSYKTVDSETSATVDGAWAIDSGVFTTLDFGLRQVDHNRNLYRYAPAFNSTLAAPSASLAVPYPGDFGRGLGSMSPDYTSFYFPRGVLDPFFQTQFRATTPRGK
jgi:iron complex outermembrane recepter protein